MLSLPDSEACLFAWSAHLQSGKLLPGLLEIHRIRVGVCPEGEEVPIGVDGRCGIAFGGKGATEAEPRERDLCRAGILQWFRQNLAIFLLGRIEIARGQIGVCADHWQERIATFKRA